MRLRAGRNNTAKNVAEWVIITRPRDINTFEDVYPRLQIPPADPMITGNLLLATNDFSIILLRILSLLSRLSFLHCAEIKTSFR